MTSLRPFEAVVSEFGARILRVSRAMVGFDDAADVWSETFLAALRAYPALPAAAKVEAWLVTIARRKAIDHLRRSKRESVSIDAIPEIADGNSDPFVPDGDLWSALERLLPRQRDVIAYHHLAELPYAEIALLMGSNEGAVRRAAADGNKKLRAIMGETSR